MQLAHVIAREDKACDKACDKATGQSLHRGRLLVRQEVHDEVVAMIGTVGRTAFPRTGKWA